MWNDLPSPGSALHKPAKLSIYIHIYVYIFFVGMSLLLCLKIYPTAISRQDVFVVHDVTACQENVLFDLLF